MQPADSPSSDPKTDLRHAAEQFVNQFLPRGVFDPHKFLTESDQEGAAAPSEDECAACITGYTTILDGVESIDLLMLIDMFVMGATEVTLGYLIRARNANLSVPPEVYQPLQASSARLVERIHQNMEGYFDRWDAVKRLQAIAELLQPPA